MPIRYYIDISADYSVAFCKCCQLTKTSKAINYQIVGNLRGS